MFKRTVDDPISETVIRFGLFNIYFVWNKQKLVSFAIIRNWFTPRGCAKRKWNRWDKNWFPKDWANGKCRAKLPFGLSSINMLFSKWFIPLSFRIGLK